MVHTDNVFQCCLHFSCYFSFIFPKKTGKILLLITILWRKGKIGIDSIFLLIYSDVSTACDSGCYRSRHLLFHIYHSSNHDSVLILSKTFSISLDSRCVLYQLLLYPNGSYIQQANYHLWVGSLLSSLRKYYNFTSWLDL